VLFAIERLMLLSSFVCLPPIAWPLGFEGLQSELLLKKGI
jgi:hypothetical protein